MLDRTARIQLAIFALVTVLTVTAISTLYLHVPSKLGIGSYTIRAEFEAAGGLYGNANVTYRGVTVGRVEDVSLTDDGVAANMRLNSNVKIPNNVSATVKSVSAIGEQYVDLVPPDDPARAPLRDGAQIGLDRTAIPQDIEGLLREADQLVSSLGNARIQELLRETFKAFNGSGPEMARLIESARLFVDEANASFPQTEQLIDQIAPFLEAQIRSGDDIKSLSDGLARFTTELRQADPQLRELLATAPGAAGVASETFSGIRPSFPMLAANLANLGRVGVIYSPSIEQALVIFPALFAALITVAGGSPLDEGGKLDFKIDLGDPPPCTTGFIPPPFIRSPADQTLRDLPKDMYCKVPQNDPSAVRGARNYPCMEFPGKRAPTIQLCRDPRGYVPIGSNPWRGPPIPTGTSVTNPESILPANHFPYIPPEADPDPGQPYAPGYFPPGAQQGPGPAANQPFQPFPPPADGGPPATTPYYPPAPFPPQGPQVYSPFTPDPFEPVQPGPGPIVSPPPPPDPNALPPAQVGPPPASGVSYGTYDQSTGVFVDPAGETGVYAPAADNLRPTEQWEDIMLDPRQAS